MLRSYVKTALRFLRRQKAYTLLNVLGLAVGLACSFLILLWVQDELRYDRFHEDGELLHRVMRNYFTSDGKVFTWSAIPKPLADVLEAEYPEVTHVALMSWEEQFVIGSGDEAFRERGRYAGPALFEMFSFPLVQGDPASVLDDPSAIVISERLARKYFGADWRERNAAIGQPLRIDARKTFTVSGVFADIPHHSSLQFDVVLPIADFIARNDGVEHWGNSGLRLFVRLREGVDAEAVSARIRNIINEHHDGGRAALFLQPYPDVHLYSDFEGGRLVGGRIEYVRMFVIVALFILLIAGINFMNLATARSTQRAREIGVRKAIGATQRALAGQFMGESLGMAFVGFAVALLLVGLCLPAFNTLAGKHFTVGDLLGVESLLVFFGVAVGTGVLAGSYPALYLSSFSPANVLRGRTKERSGAIGFRKGLVVFQFALSILLIVGTITVYRQIEYIQTKNLGLNKENVISTALEGGVRERYEAFEQELERQPGIAGVTAASQNPLSIGQSTSDPTWPGKDPDSEILFHILDVRHDFTETMQMTIAAGRTFSRDFATDTLNYLINEEAARAMGLDDPLGTSLAFWGQEGTIVGVVEDFHMTSLYSPIEPTIIRLDPDNTSRLFVRTEPGATETALARLEALYNRFNPAYPFAYGFLDANYAQMYRSEMVIGKLARYFTVLAVFVACLGLFGLAAYAAERRTREIGIRKALGASASNLVLLLSRDFVKLVLLAFVVAAPVAYYVAQRWLDHFAYRIDLGVGLFVAAGVVAVLIAALTVSYQSLRTALTDPVEALRTE